MKSYLPIVVNYLMLCCLVPLGAMGATSAKQIIVWNPSIGVERSADGALVSGLHAAGMEADVLSFALVSGEGDDDNGSFAVSGGNALYATETLSVGEYSIRLRATGEGASAVEEPVEVSVVPGRVKPRVAVGSSHSVFLDSDGTVYTSGSGTRGQLGHGDTRQWPIPIPIEHEALADHTIIDIAAGSHHAMLLALDGTVFSFGWGVSGRLGHGDTEDRKVPSPIEHGNLAGIRIARIKAGEAHSVLVCEKGDVFTFGYGYYGQLGHGDTENRLVPTRVEDAALIGHAITEVADGRHHTVLLGADGTVFTFGAGWDGRLGHGDDEGRLTPTPIEHPNLGGETIEKIAAGNSHTVLLSSDGTVFSFGAGSSGELGHGDRADFDVPVAIDSEAIADSSIIAIDAGNAFTVLLTSDGAVFSFGAGFRGKLGHGDDESRDVPVPVEHESLDGVFVSDFGAGGHKTFLLSSEVEVYSFGSGFSGALGHGDETNRFVPTRIEFFRQPGYRALLIDPSAGEGDGKVAVNGDPISEWPYVSEVPLGTELVIEAIPDEGAYLAEWSGDLGATALSHARTIDEDTRLNAVYGIEQIVLWNDTVGTEMTGSGELVGILHAAGPGDEDPVLSFTQGSGDDDNASFLLVNDELRAAATLPEGEYSVRLRAEFEGGGATESAFSVAVVPGRVSPKIAAGGMHTVLLAADGTVYTFGLGESGQLGHGDTQDRLEPTPVEHENLEGHTIVDIAAGTHHTALLSSDGSVFTFGLGREGSLGHGDLEDKLAPTKIVDDALAGHRVTAVAAKGWHTLMLAADGSLFIAGVALWSGSVDPLDGAVPLRTGREAFSGYLIAEMAPGMDSPFSVHMLFRSTKGSLFVIGSGRGGRLGLGEAINQSRPALLANDAITGQGTIASITAGMRHSAGLSSDGTLFTFGEGGDGQLGHGDFENRLTPNAIDGLTVKAVEAGSFHTVLLSSDGTVHTFGRNERGELGVGDAKNRSEPNAVEQENLQEHTITAIAGGGQHTVLLSSSGTVFTFGNGVMGALGHGDMEDRLVPRPIEGFNLKGRRTLRFDAGGAGDGALLVNGQSVSEFPFLYSAEEGLEITVEAVPPEGSFFDRWLGDLSGGDATQAIVLDSDKSVEVRFGKEGMVVWNRTIGAERTETGALVSLLHVSGRRDESYAFELVSGSGGDDNVRFSIQDNELRTAESLSKGEYSVRLHVSNGAGTSVEKAVTISVVEGKVAPQVAAAASHSVALSADGTVATFGIGPRGQLGHGDTDPRAVPTTIDAEGLSEHVIRTIAAGGGMAAGSGHTVLLAADGTVFTFGAGDSGQLGHGDTEDRLVPTAIEHENLEGYTIIDVAAGVRHTLLLSSDGTVFSFGSSGQLGHGDTEGRSVPTSIDHENLSGHLIATIAAGAWHNILVSLDGAVFSFGSNSGQQSGGQLGLGDIEDRLVPTRIIHQNLSGHTITSAAAGLEHSILLSSDGTVFSFGSDRYGQAGHAGNGSHLVPRAVEHEVLPGRLISDLAAGDRHSVLLDSDGTVFTFGRNSGTVHSGGQLGHGDTEDRAVPTEVVHNNLDGYDVVGIAAGGEHTILFASDGTLFSFGRSGRLGHEFEEDRLVPTQIENLRLVPGPAGYERFAEVMDEAGLSGADAAPEASPFGDGIGNLLKYAFNMDLTGPDRRMLGAGDVAGLPAVTQAESEAGRVLRIEFVRRRDSDLIYTPKFSTDLVDWNAVVEEGAVSEVDADWERVVVEIPLAPATLRAFGVVEVRFP